MDGGLDLREIERRLSALEASFSGLERKMFKGPRPPSASGRGVETRLRDVEDQIGDLKQEIQRIKRDIR